MMRSYSTTDLKLWLRCIKTSFSQKVRGLSEAPSAFSSSKRIFSLPLFSSSHVSINQKNTPAFWPLLSTQPLCVAALFLIVFLHQRDSSEGGSRHKRFTKCDCCKYFRQRYAGSHNSMLLFVPPHVFSLERALVSRAANSFYCSDTVTRHHRFYKAPGWDSWGLPFLQSKK